MSNRDHTHTREGGTHQASFFLSSLTRIPSNFCSFFSLSPLLWVSLESLRVIFLDNPKHFLTIYALACLPLSLLLASLSLSTRALKSHIDRLEWLFNVAPIWVEADNVRDESRADLRALYGLKALHGAPILLFSLLALAASASAASLSCAKKRPTIGTCQLAVRSAWARALLTCMACWAVRMAWEALLSLSTMVAPARCLAGATVAGAVVEVYLMAVLGLAMVASVVEDRAGLLKIKSPHKLLSFILAMLLTT